MTRRSWLLIAGFAAALAGLGLPSANAPAAPGAGQNPSPPVDTAPGVIRAETNLVVVDVIATNKKGEYLKDLEKKDFKVYEDDSEQPIASFSRESDISPDAPGHERYMVLFFDDSTMSPALQIQARNAAGKFVESTASPHRLMAVIDFGGTLKVVQNFTADGDLLKRAVSSVEYSAVNPNAGAGSMNMQVATLGLPSFSQTEGDFGARSMLLSLRDIAKSLHNVPGRKTLILFSSGFPLNAERESELTATIDALNKANVAVYPVDVRGLATSPSPNMMNPAGPGRTPGFPPGAALDNPESAFPHLPILLAALEPLPMPDPQKGGGGTAGGSGSSGTSGSSGVGSGSSKGGGSTSGSSGSTGGTTSGGRGGGANPNSGNTGTNRANNLNNSLTNCSSTGGIGAFGAQNPNCVNRQIIPTIPDSVTTNQQVLYALAKGTGGFEIFNTNDFLAGLDKVASEINEYYNIGYTPPRQDHDGSYHRIKIEVNRKDVLLRYRNGYYDVKSADMLAGKPEGKTLEEQAASPSATGDIPVALCAPYFYVEPGVARVNLALSIPGSSIQFEKEKSDIHSDVNVLAIAYRPNGSVAARFSDTMKLDYPKKDQKEVTDREFDYQNTFNIAPGSYTLKLVLSAGGEKFGKYVVPLTVEPFTGDALSVSGPALGLGFLPVSKLAARMDAALMEDRTPLLFNGMQLIPSTTSQFARTSQPVFYVEVYDPSLKESTPPRVGVQFSIVDKKTNQSVVTSNTVLINGYAQAGNPLVPVGLVLPVAQLQAGDYRLEVKGLDEKGKISPVRSADFSVQ